MMNRKVRPGDAPVGRRAFGRKFWIALAALMVLGMAGTATYLAWLIHSSPSMNDLRGARVAQPSVLLSADGETLATLHRAHQEEVTLQQVSPYLIKALLATEDSRFYRHHGIDFRRTMSSVWQTLHGKVQGGSTITQQLVRNLFPEEIGRERNVNRKLREMVAALRIEQLYSKQKILETYLNTVSFPYNVYGIGMAARTYYNKPAADLDMLESATLVAMLKGPGYYDPSLHPARVRARRNLVLRQMLLHHDLTQADYQSMRDRPLALNLNMPSDPPGPAPHFVENVRKWLTDWAEQHDYDPYADGLRVETTLDGRLQQAATEALERQAGLLQNIADVEWGQASAGTLSTNVDDYAAMRKRMEPFGYFWKTHGPLTDAFIRETAEYKTAAAQGEPDAITLARLKDQPGFMARLEAGKSHLESGFVAIDPASGEVRAWVGSRDFASDQYDHVAQAHRQPGSTFKPFVYGAALEHGRTPNTVYYDKPVEIKLGDGKVWRPTDMGGTTGEAMTLRQGLVYSKNVITAQVMQDVGLPDIISLARAAGVNKSRLDPVPSLALGSSAVTLLEMVSAYSTIADQGEYRKPIMVKRIRDRSGKVIAEFGEESKRAMTEPSAITLLDIMRDVVSQGTGLAIRGRFGIVADVAGKTGTTQNNTDGWFILMHPNLVAGAWIGFNDARVTMRSSYWGQGGHSAVLVVGDFFRTALKDKLIDANAQFPHPPASPAVTAAAAGDSDADQVPADHDEQPRAASSVVVIDGAQAETAPAAAPGADDAGKWQKVDAIPQATPDPPDSTPPGG
jgi:penicillin-binding protein 1A